LWFVVILGDAGMELEAKSSSDFEEKAFFDCFQKVLKPE
jgi:hypothetical protein